MDSLFDDASLTFVHITWKREKTRRYVTVKYDIYDI